ncbi:MAG: DUF4032 domain-containing protein [Verrucomicrobia bacterium]|nr:DUF4032 domain-containing protein [Verrucomicrobiota bacterium]
MAEHDKRPDVKQGPTNEWVQKTSLYREFIAEREEILRHKWLESEKAGHDIGFEKALVEWVSRYRTAWRRYRHQVPDKGGSPS